MTSFPLMITSAVWRTGFFISLSSARNVYPNSELSEKKNILRLFANFRVEDKVLICSHIICPIIDTKYIIHILLRFLNVTVFGYNLILSISCLFFVLLDISMYLYDLHTCGIKTAFGVGLPEQELLFSASPKIAEVYLCSKNSST